MDFLNDLICKKIRAVKLAAQELADIFIASEMFNKVEKYENAMKEDKLYSFYLYFNYTCFSLNVKSSLLTIN